MRNTRIEDLWRIKDPFINRFANLIGFTIVEKEWHSDGRFGLAFRRSGEPGATMFGKDDCGTPYWCLFKQDATSIEIIGRMEKASLDGLTLFVSNSMMGTVGDHNTIWPKHCSIDKMKILLDLRGGGEREWTKHDASCACETAVDELGKFSGIKSENGNHLQ